MKILVLALTGLLPSLAQPSQQGQRLISGVISGTIEGDDGTAIVGGSVGLQLVSPSPAARLRQTAWSAVSGAGGSFRFDQLMEGEYRICAQAPKTTWLNPCEWGLQPPVVSLSSSRSSASVAMVLNKGAAVPIRVDDPGQLLVQNEGRTAGAHILLGVGNDAFAFRPAPVISHDATGRTHQVVVPTGTPVKLVVFSSFFRMTDAAGTPLPAARAAAIPITLQPGQQPPPIRLIVTGGNRQ